MHQISWWSYSLLIRHELFNGLSTWSWVFRFLFLLIIHVLNCLCSVCYSSKIKPTIWRKILVLILLSIGVLLFKTNYLRLSLPQFAISKFMAEQRQINHYSCASVETNTLYSNIYWLLHDNKRNKLIQISCYLCCSIACRW